ncbi:MAG: TA system VapC family ribonuclease toxin [Acidobacteriota bacterium]
MIAIDTNLLVYAHRARAPHHHASQRAIEHAAGQGRWGVALATLVEFWAVVTHPSSEGGPSSPLDASAFLDALVEAGAEVWEPGDGFGARLSHLAADLEVTGPRVFDLQIALTAFERGATVMWTADAGFVKLPGLRLHNPLAARQR